MRAAVTEVLVHLAAKHAWPGPVQVPLRRMSPLLPP